MNKVYLSGIIKEIKESHSIGSTSFDKAKLISKRPNGQEDVIDLKFKSLSNKYKENENITLLGNIRSYSEKQLDESSKVCIYVFTYFDLPDMILEEENNRCEVDGRICKISSIRTTKDKKQNIHFIVANNIDNENGRRLSSYIPCIAWGKLAKEISSLSVNAKVKLVGEIHSREHKKFSKNGEFELRVAHELLVKEYEVLED